MNWDPPTWAESPTREQFDILLVESGLRGEGLVEARRAWAESPLGAWAVAIAALDRPNPGVALLGMLRAGEHKRGGSHERRTGFRRIRGSHGDTYVYDPRGVDPLPLDYELPR